MHRKISRRDFMDGMAVAVGGAVAAGALSGCSAGSYGGLHNEVATPPDGWNYAGAGNKAYPPAMTALRGSTNPAMRVPHELRDGFYWEGRKSVRDSGERYDLIVVGAGISGLSAAHYYKQRKPDAKILILDNHDDFGGHARRNEFRPNGQLLIGYGGSQSIEAPSVWSPQAKKLLTDLGIEVQKFNTYYNQNFNKQWKLNDSEFFTRDLFSGDHLAVMQDDTQTAQTLASAPMSEQAKAAFLALQDKPGDYLPGLPDEQKKLKLVELTYKQYLRDYAKMPDEVLNYLQTFTSDEWGFGIDAFGAIDAWAEDYPGFGGLKLNRTKQPYKYCGPTVQLQWNEDEPYIYHFPDGNNGICKLLIGQLIPNTGAPATMDAEPLARIDYTKLDVAGNDVRLRLGSPCVRVQHKGGGIDADEVEVDFDRGGKVYRAHAGHVVMACYNTMIPYLMQDLPGDQKQNLFYGTKLPIVYAMVQLRNWEAWQKLRIYHTRFTSGDWVVAELDYPVSFPGYQFSKDPSQPILVHMIRMATAPGYDNPRGGIGPGRRDLFARPFSSFERTIRDQLARLLSGGGFDPAKDIQAVTVNRWGHGYALEYGRPWAKFWPDGPLPSVLGRRPFGRITIANSDSQNRAYADAAIDAAWRAVNELP
ncbi:NAD(P)/FAD-dependent oxidoreductase [Actinomadura rupiterrae]|uniref:NAD(P)/FAD-dependent oxidoreductase n=1 Tax=Actinomadura rupiterrae TaxID=559627 RepID=UPI0020A24850|nr:NAD(P)/FAD-dependent oxidoreductase [Actinomadura rupiterrae]MCP2339669.1 spermidine dehydrogenase [Actinomadura rupiterrae]